MTDTKVLPGRGVLGRGVSGSLVALALGVQACSTGSIAGADLATGGTGGSSGSGGSAGHGGGSGGLAPGGSGGTASGTGGTGGTVAATAPEFRSNPPLLDTEVTVSGAEDDLFLVNSQLQQDADETPYTEWFSEVLNQGQTVACYVRAHVVFFDADNQLVWQNDALGSFANAAPYDDPSGTRVMPCLAPGEQGLMYGNEFGGSEFNVRSIVRLEATIESVQVLFAEPHAGAPTFSTPNMTASSSGTYTVTGSITAVVDMGAPGGEVFGRGNGGFYQFWEPLTYLGGDVLSAGQTWTYEESGDGDTVYGDLRAFARWTDVGAFVIAASSPEPERANRQLLSRAASELAETRSRQRSAWLAFRDERRSPP